MTKLTYTYLFHHSPNNIFEQAMSITLKQLGHFIVDFINKTFVPLLRSGIAEHERCLEQWKQASDLVSDIEKVTYWQLESCLKALTPNQTKKNDPTRSPSLTFKTYDNFFEKKETAQSYPVEETTKQTQQKSALQMSDSKSKPYKYSSLIDHYQTKKSVDAVPSKGDSLIDPQGFDKLIHSFRKLCSNFESNHKKLLRQDQNFKQNFKEEVGHF